MMSNTSTILVFGNGSVECELGSSFANSPELRLFSNQFFDSATLRFKNPQAVDSVIGLLEEVKTQFSVNGSQAGMLLDDFRTGRNSAYTFDDLDNFGLSTEHVQEDNLSNGYAFLQEQLELSADQEADIIAEINSEIDLAITACNNVAIPKAQNYINELMEYTTIWLEGISTLEDSHTYSVAIRKFSELSEFMLRASTLVDDQAIDEALSSIGEQLSTIQGCLDEPTLAFFTDQYDRAMALLFPDVDSATSPDSLVDLIEIHNLQSAKPE